MKKVNPNGAIAIAVVLLCLFYFALQAYALYEGHPHYGRLTASVLGTVASIIIYARME